MGGILIVKGVLVSRSNKTIGGIKSENYVFNFEYPFLQQSQQSAICSNTGRHYGSYGN